MALRLLRLWPVGALLLLGASAGVAFAGSAGSAGNSVVDAAESVTIEYQVLTYEASIAGAPAGVATVAVARSAQLYRIAGQARATGLLDALSPWRARFWAAGDLVDGVPAPRTYRYVERGRDKRRDVTVSDGLLTVIKNDKQRPTRPSLPGLDVLTALFVEPRCAESLRLHTGRHGYRLQTAAAAASLPETKTSAASRCSYRVVDEDQDSFKAQLQFGPVNGHQVPTRIAVTGALSGVMELTDSRTVAVACGAGSDGLATFLCGLSP
ncbi:MAG: DUF3108 domain-containing protein [Pseudomonadales bacterium]